MISAHGCSVSARAIISSRSASRRRRFERPVRASVSASRRVPSSRRTFSRKVSAIRTIAAPSVATANARARSVHRGDRVVGENSQRGEREERRQRHHTNALDAQRAGGWSGCPGRGADHQRRGGPQGCDERAVHAGAGGVHVHEEAVHDGSGRQPDPQQRPGGAGAPAGEREDGDHAADQKKVGQQVREIQGDQRRRRRPRAARTPARCRQRRWRGRRRLRRARGWRGTRARGRARAGPSPCSSRGRTRTTAGRRRWGSAALRGRWRRRRSSTARRPPMRQMPAPRISHGARSVDTSRPREMHRAAATSSSPV